MVVDPEGEVYASAVAAAEELLLLYQFPTFPEQNKSLLIDILEEQLQINI